MHNLERKRRLAENYEAMFETLKEYDNASYTLGINKDYKAIILSYVVDEWYGMDTKTRLCHEDLVREFLEITSIGMDLNHLTESFIKATSLLGLRVDVITGPIR